MTFGPNPPFSDLDFTTWLVGPARVALSPNEIVAESCERLLAAGVPLWRVRVGQRLANPLIGAWGVIWTRGSGAEEVQRPPQHAGNEFVRR